MYPHLRPGPTRCPGTTIWGRSGGSLQPDADEKEDSSILERHKLFFQFEGNNGFQIMINATHSHLTISVQLLYYGRYVDYDIFENIDVK